MANAMPWAAMLPPGALTGLPGYGNMITPQMVSAAAPQLNQLNQFQAVMTDTFPTVLPANQSAQVVFLIASEGQVQSGIRFADEDGNHWLRPYGELPQRVDEEGS